ncbi:MAG: pre-peptidase C-terminal domain-containing protein [Caldilineaceae bacterium]
MPGRQRRPVDGASTAPGGWTQIGVVSWGNGCGRADFPGVYARVVPFVDWIAQQTGQTSGTPDAYEPDDTRATARVIDVGASQVHTLHVAGDVDWLQFTVPTTGSYVVETSNLGANADTQLALFDATGALLAEDDDGGAGFASRLEFTGDAAADYFARVTHARAGAGGAATDYTVSVRRQPGSDADKYEPDNDAAAAPTIATDGTAQTHNFHVARDADWVRFTAQAGTTYAIETANLGADADPFMELYDARLSQIAVDDDGGDGLAARLAFAAATGGVYFVRVTNYDENAFGPATQYDLRITAGASPGGTAPDALEPDNVAADATDIAPDGTPQRHTFHVPGDVDYIRFTATAGTSYVIATANLGAAGDTVIAPYDSALNLVAEDDDGGDNAASRIEFVAAATQTYSLSIRDYNPTAYGAATEYDVSVTALGAPAAGDAYEPDDTPATAATIAGDGTPSPRFPRGRRPGLGPLCGPTRLPLRHRDGGPGPGRRHGAPALQRGAGGTGDQRRWRRRTGVPARICPGGQRNALRAGHALQRGRGRTGHPLRPACDPGESGRRRARAGRHHGPGVDHRR